MRIALETGEVPPDRAMDACAQAVVWYLKRRELSKVDYEWYLARGTELAETSDLVDPAVLSSWYRGVAMVPASRGEVESTHAAMERAREAALVTLSHRPRAYEMHLMKTYYESSLKEHMYLTRDIDRAEESGQALIAIDPAWAPSYGELAEAYLAFGRPKPAAELFETAISIGPPYVGHHRLQAARCHQKLGHDEEALEHYLALVLPEGTSHAVVLAALSLAEKTDHPARRELAAALASSGPMGSGR
jgi:tetratricopeptide (TPR) repeat protein